MNHKVLLADDSLTIQKVIKITLANQPFEITDCSTDDELFKVLPNLKPEIVFLDFNLSEKYTGYELSSKIKEVSPTSQVLFLLGTFDTVDESAMEKCGASDKIVKPFDSNKFISICKRLVDNAPIEEILFPAPVETTSVEVKAEDQWTVSHSVEQTEAIKENSIDNEKPFDVRAHLNPLDQEISAWGMSVPGVINLENATGLKIDLPPVINSTENKSQTTPIVEKNSSKDEIKFPSQDDLDFPDMGISSEPVVQEAPPKTTSKLISIDTFHSAQDSTGDFEIEHSINSLVETDISSIEDQIRDEVEEDLWHADEFETVKNSVAQKIEELKSEAPAERQKFDEELFRPLDAGEELEWDVGASPISPVSMTHETSPSVNLDQLRDEISLLIKKEVKEYMDQMFKQQVEKISWEVIPDLAENLIKKEITKISNKILNESN